VSDEAPVFPAPPDEPIPPDSRQLFRNRGFVRLFAAQVTSSLGDWIGLIAILAMAGRISNSGYAVGLVMIARMLPGFLLAPVGGALVDRWNRRTVMVSCDLGRAGLLLFLPIFDTLWGLVVLSFLIEVLSLMWGPAKDASVPNVVPGEHLASANSLGLVAAFGTFPLAALVSGSLAGVAKWLGRFEALSRFQVDNESLAIWFDSLTFLVSALLISRLSLDEGQRLRPRRVEWTQTFRDIVDGLRYIRSNPLVRGVMIGLAGGLLGGGAMVPLGPLFARDVLGAGSGGFFVLMTALGVGAGVGVLALVVLQQRLPRERVFVFAVAACGSGIIVVASVSTLTPASLLVVIVGAAAGCGYVSGFTVLQESVADELRGRTFAMLYTVVRLCLLLALAAGPFAADLFDAISRGVVGGDVDIGGATLHLPGVRLALWLGGFVTIVSAFFARRRMLREHAAEGAPV
jgi:dTMP kinase